MNDFMMSKRGNFLPCAKFFMYQGMENCGLFNIWIALETMMPIENLDQWRRRLADDYETFMRQIAPLNLSDDHQVMLGLGARADSAAER
jgi:hypothetical protein